MIGNTIAHYEILEILGEGGMGIVYKARDRNLDRIVALKVLKSGAVELPEEVRQFEREAKTISALNHPHIATIHDRGEYEGKHYLVFEFLSGGTLKTKLARRVAEGRPFSVDEVVRYAVEAGRGLAHAHGQSIIHRDVKTENLMLTEQGAVKVTDFGLAQWNTSATTSSGQGATGTAAYMSPEQAQGLAIDARSDVFSFGLVLYELLTGETAFQGLYVAAVVYDVINTPTAPVKEKRPDAPDALCRIVERATAKSPDDRYQSMDQLLGELAEFVGSGDIPVTDVRPSVPPPSRRRSLVIGGIAAALLLAISLVPWPIREPTPDRVPAQPEASESISIAVLPLENLSGDPSKDYLADGMTESLITDLAKRARLHVISRTSVMRYKNAPKSLPEIAAELNVQRIVEGTVLQIGDEVRITAQLIDAESDEHIWAESYRSSMGDVLGLQQEISQAIAAEIDTRLAASGPRRTVAQIDPEAYEAYLRARQHAFQWNLQSVRQSITGYKRAIEIDPNYGEAHAGLAMAYGFLSMNGGATPAESWSLARASAERALDIDNSLDSAHTALGFVQAMYDWNWTAAEASFRRALELNPAAVDARHACGMTLLTPLGRVDEALDMILEAQRLDPLSAAINTSLADVYFFRREYAKAIEQYQRNIELDPGFESNYISLGFTQFVAGHPESAAEAFQQAVTQAPDTPMIALLPPALSGGKETVLAHLDGIEEAGDEQYLFANQIAMLYIMLDERDAALDWLERAYRQRATSITFINVSPLFEDLRDDPRFAALVRKMNLL